MVFESIINPFRAERSPWIMFFVGILFSSIAILMRLWIFDKESGMVIILLTVLVSTPLLYETLKLEEKKDLNIEEERVLLKEHGRAIMFFVFMFIGLMVSFALWYMFLPQDIAKDVFTLQINEINSVNAPQSKDITGNAIQRYPIFFSIFLNNVKVLFFSLLFAFIFGTGAIFILTWNAAIAGVAMGIFSKSLIEHSFFGSFAIGFLRYALHGIPEVLAYLVAGMAGGIISVAVIRHDFMSSKFKHIVIDSVDLTILSVVIVFIAALLEVYVTPLFF